MQSVTALYSALAQSKLPASHSLPTSFSSFTTPTHHSQLFPPTRFSMAATSSAKVWLITGCSSGIGRELALAALARSDSVIATARSTAKLQYLKQRGALTVALDVTDSDDVIQKTVAEAIGVFGRIDILVNNAGYLLEGAVEECR